MSTAKTGASPHFDKMDVSGMRFAVVTARWNSNITYALRDGAVETFRKAGVKDADVELFYVPGAVELTYAASQLIETGQFDAVIVFGCVIRGGTPHFDYVCQSVTQGVTMLNADCDVPVIFGILTVDNEQDALDRAGGRLGNKGSEAAEAAMAMAEFTRTAKDL